MVLAEHRPLLREGKIPIAPLPPQHQNVLHDAWLLIVGLFDEEGVVLQRFRRTQIIFCRESRAETYKCCDKRRNPNQPSQNRSP